MWRSAEAWPSPGRKPSPSICKEPPSGTRSNGECTSAEGWVPTKSVLSTRQWGIPRPPSLSLSLSEGEMEREPERPTMGRGAQWGRGPEVFPTTQCQYQRGNRTGSHFTIRNSVIAPRNPRAVQRKAAGKAKPYPRTEPTNLSLFVGYYEGSFVHSPPDSKAPLSLAAHTYHCEHRRDFTSCAFLRGKQL